MSRPTVAFFGSSLLSSYWNGAATYYRGIIRALHARGWSVTFYEPDAYDRQAHVDLAPPPWARVVVYDPAREQDVLDLVADAAQRADIVVKASGVGVHDEAIEAALPQLCPQGRLCLFWDVDAPATLERMQQDPDDHFRLALPRYDLVLTYGGGAPVVDAYTALGARGCVPVYNALDPLTHHPVAPEPRFAADLAFLGNRLPDREARVDEFFVRAAAALPRRRFLLGGNGWHDRELPPNVHRLGHVSTNDHNALNCSATAVLNINRASMARFGHSPATRVFEAAGAGACLITDAFEGIDAFLEPDREVLVATSGDDVADHVARLTPERAHRIGAAARARVLSAHTYDHRADLVEQTLGVGAPGARAC
jgi:spore maturation protein CgeB